MSKCNGRYLVSATEGRMAERLGLKVEYNGIDATVTTSDSKEYDAFWSCRLAYLRRFHA